MNKIGVAIVGTGFGQQIHLPGLQAHPRTEVVAIHNRDLDKAKAILDFKRILGLKLWLYTTET